MMRCLHCHSSGFSSKRRRRAAVFHIVALLELIAGAEEAGKGSRQSNNINPDFYNAANRRRNLIDTAIDSLLAVYPSLYGGEPF